MSKKMRMTQVVSTEDLSPHMKRIVFQGEDLADFPDKYETAHVKVLVLNSHESETSIISILKMKDRMRSYTVRKLDIKNREITIDFEVHKHKGLVADWHLFAGDLTGLPAVVATIEKLPENAEGYAFLQVPTEADKQKIKTPKNMHIRWVLNDDSTRNLLKEHINSTDWLNGTPHIFIAAENSHVKEINGMLKKQPNYDKRKTYASGYWQPQKGSV